MLCAVSGGRDSVCLLHYLCALGAAGIFPWPPPTMNHGQRAHGAAGTWPLWQELCRELERSPDVWSGSDVPGHGP